VLKSRILIVGLSILTIFLTGCQEVKHAWSGKVETIDEVAIKEIPLIGPASESRAEFSGMAWCGTNLILLPQYPDRFEMDGSDHVFSIPQIDILAYLSGQYQDGIQPAAIPFDAQGIEEQIPGFEGFEAIVFNDDVFYVTVEARDKDEMMGYILTGQVIGDCERLVLYPTSLHLMEPQADLDNMSHETLVYYQDQIYAIYEGNGVNVNPMPIAHIFDRQLGKRPEQVALDNIEYRITDATDPDEFGVFWAINYYFPGDTDLRPTDDRIAMDYGVGVTHLKSEAVERIIKLIIDEQGIRIVNQEPIYLELLKDDSRNWEGIVKFEDGFLLVTDKFPNTILAYVEGKTSDN
jgi:hypothetical protein